MKKNCELCKSAARVFCESDQASLCWDCDSKVHTANFLVEKHSRNLLCHICQSPTAWNASGAKLGRTVSVCEGCVDGCEGVKESRDRFGDGEEGYDRDVDTETDLSDDDDDEDSGSDEDDEDGDESEDEGIGEDEDGDNQVVPESSTPPPAASSSSEDEGDSSTRRSENRFRYTTVDLDGDENDRECSYRKPFPAADFIDSSSARPSKRRKTDPVQSESMTAAILESIKRFHDQDLATGNETKAATVAEICKLSKDPADSRQ